MHLVETTAREVGLYCTTYSPGDGYTRYRFSREDGDYFAVRGIYTALGRKDALTWLEGYRQGRAVVGEALGTVNA